MAPQYKLPRHGAEREGETPTFVVKRIPDSSLQAPQRPAFHCLPYPQRMEQQGLQTDLPGSRSLPTAVQECKNEDLTIHNSTKNRRINRSAILLTDFAGFEDAGGVEVVPNRSSRVFCQTQVTQERSVPGEINTYSARNILTTPRGRTDHCTAGRRFLTGSLSAVLSAAAAAAPLM